MDRSCSAVAEHLVDVLGIGRGYVGIAEEPRLTLRGLLLEHVVAVCLVAPELAATGLLKALCSATMRLLLWHEFVSLFFGGFGFARSVGFGYCGLSGSGFFLRLFDCGELLLVWTEDHDHVAAFEVRAELDIG